VTGKKLARMDIARPERPISGRGVSSTGEVRDGEESILRKKKSN
jgi:hypothetical protein